MDVFGRIARGTENAGQAERLGARATVSSCISSSLGHSSSLDLPVGAFFRAGREVG